MTAAEARRFSNEGEERNEFLAQYAYQAATDPVKWIYFLAQEAVIKAMVHSKYTVFCEIHEESRPTKKQVAAALKRLREDGFKAELWSDGRHIDISW